MAAAAAAAAAAASAAAARIRHSESPWIWSEVKRGRKTVFLLMHQRPELLKKINDPGHSRYAHKYQEAPDCFLNFVFKAEIWA